MLLKNVDNQENQVKKSTNGNRRYSMLLLALLFIGMGTYGTYAYFTDSTSVDGNIKLQMGTVSLGNDNGEWSYTAEADKINTQIGIPSEGEYNFLNVQPGDVFTKTVKVTYTGSLDGQLTINQAPLPTKSGLNYTIQVKKGNVVIDHAKESAVTKGDTFTVILTATIPLYGEKEENSDSDNAGRNKENSEINIDLLEDAVTFTVEQNK